ncbi:TPA: glycoside hydrolase family 19 protein, partial [Photobacterium damselae]
MTFLYPFNQQNGSPYPSQKAFESVLKKTKQGTFGFNGRNFSWHGGVHVNRDSAPWLQDESPLQAIADGVVVACRISDTYQHSTFEGQTLDYSSDFCLIQHTVTNPKQSGEAFTFYALYMHLAPLCAPHRALSKYPRYRLRTSQSGLLGEVSGESITLEQGSIIEATNEEIVQ